MSNHTNKCTQKQEVRRRREEVRRRREGDPEAPEPVIPWRQKPSGEKRVETAGQEGGRERVRTQRPSSHRGCPLFKPPQTALIREGVRRRREGDQEGVRRRRGGVPGAPALMVP